MAQIAVLLGSVTPPGRLSAALNGAIERVAANGHSASLFDLGQQNLGFADGRPVGDLTDDTPHLIDAITAADAVILGTPVYRATMTGVLKNALDLLPVDALRGKPVGLVVMGATMHHYLGAETHLRDVLAWFGAFTMPVNVYLASSDFVEGRLSDAAATTLDVLFTATAVLPQC